MRFQSGLSEAGPKGQPRLSPCDLVFVLFCFFLFKKIICLINFSKIKKKSNERKCLSIFLMKI